MMFGIHRVLYICPRPPVIILASVLNTLPIGLLIGIVLQNVSGFYYYDLPSGSDGKNGSIAYETFPEETLCFELSEKIN